MKIRILKRHWDKAKKLQMTERGFSALTDCMLGLAVKDAFPERTVDDIGFTGFRLDGIRYAAIEKDEMENLIRQWCFGDPFGRKSLPKTFEFIF